MAYASCACSATLMNSMSALTAFKDFTRDPGQGFRVSLGSYLYFATSSFWPIREDDAHPRDLDTTDRFYFIINVGAGAGESSCSASHGTPPAIPEPDLATGEALVSMAVASLSTLQSLNEEQAQQGDDSSETSEGDPIVLMECAEKGLPAQLQAGLQLGGEPAASGPRQHARALNLLTTVLRTCAGAVTVCVGGSAGAQYALAGMACALAARGPPQPHDEVGRAADAFLASLALARHSPETFDVALQHIEDIAKTESWWARLACVSFAQPLLFYGLPFLCAEPARAARAEAFALALMRDPRVEVRQAAAKLLTGLMHCQALPNEEKTIKKLIKFCHSKEIVQRHCGVLGLCGYLASRPYSLGNRIGAVLYELSKHTNAPEPIPSSIRTTLADFRRTHQDDWPKHREALTAEELDLLAELTSPPTYCA
ncbi:Proteasome activator complex subunit 4 [Eumeta japonica]|uniref:Proteasome activator complex subunit 4 n=1 Tax=Eumeta variegata TaxID=151549 RepID=A0A4C1WSV1_EUMVA|nr:Proteasome activator complex subunit 4 [Eumeta japonica]